MQVNKNSLFAILLRSPWWVSFVAAAATGVPARYVLANFSMPEAYAIFVALPFLVIGCVVAWRQLRAPSTQKIAATLEALRSMSWDGFSAALEDAFRRDGCAVTRPNAAGADLELVKAGRVTVVACKRWKVARTGIAPLKELDAARRAREAQECIYVAAGGVTDNAIAFAAANNIRLLQGAELAQFLPIATQLSPRS